MTGQYLNIAINKYLIFPIKIFLNSNNIFEEKNIDNDDTNNIVINNDLFQLYKPSYKLLISNNDLEKLYYFLEEDIKFVLKDLFSNDENLRKLLSLKLPSNKNENNIDNFHLLLNEEGLSTYNYVHTDSLIRKNDKKELNFDKIYKLGKVSFVIKINSPIWNLTLLINDYTKLPNTENEFINMNEFIRDDIKVLKTEAKLIPKILIEEEDEDGSLEELVEQKQVDLKPEFKYSYKKLKFIENNNSMQIIIMNKKKK